MATKTGASPDQSLQFQGLFLMAAVAKGASGNDTPQIKGKLQVQDEKSSATQIKKKSAGVDLIETPVSSLDTTTPRPFSANASSQLVDSLPPTQSSGQIVNDSRFGSTSDVQQSLHSSAGTSASVLVQRPTDSPKRAWTDKKAADGLSAKTALSETKPVYGASSSNSEPLKKQAVEAQVLGSQRDTSLVAPTAVPVVAGANVANSADVKSAIAAVLPITSMLPPVPGESVAPRLVETAKDDSMPVVSIPSTTDMKAVPSVVQTAPVAVAKSNAVLSVEVPMGGAELPSAGGPFVSTHPTLQSGTPKAASSGLPANIAKVGDAPDTNPAAQVIVSASSATQQAAAATIVSAQPDLQAVSPKPAASGQTESIAKVGDAPDTNSAVQVLYSASAAPQAVVAATIVSAQPALQAVSPKAAASGQTDSIAQVGDASDKNPALQVIDSNSEATQQTAAAVEQSVAVPASLLGSRLGNESQATSAIVANPGPSGGSAVDTAKEGAGHQSSFVVKPKSASLISAGGSKSVDDSDSSSQVGGVSAAPVSSVSKGAEAPGTVNQDVSDSKSAIHIADVQQAAPTEIGSRNPQLAPGGSATDGRAAQSVPFQAVPDSQPMQSISSAQLTQSMRSSEMKLGMQSAEFGNISISTSLNHQALSAQISLDHSELGRALAVHLPAIEEKLGSAYGVQAKVELRESNNPSSSNDSGYSNSGQQSREHRQSQGGGPTASSGAMLERIAARASFTPVSTTAAASRLDIRI